MAGKTGRSGRICRLDYLPLNLLAFFKHDLTPVCYPCVLSKKGDHHLDDDSVPAPNGFFIPSKYLAAMYHLSDFANLP
jgi:hypothetical protein